MDDRPDCSLPRFLGGAAQTLAIVALFVGGGLGGAVLARAAYPGAAMAEGHSGQARHSEPPRVWLVDGFNLLHAAVLQGRDRADWWRGSARARVLELADRFPDPEAEIWVVFDGEDPKDDAGREPPRVRQVFAPSADEWLVRRVKQAPPGETVAVVTADRQLADRARHHGAEVISPRAFAERCRGWL
jgi:hypothetical protein